MKKGKSDHFLLRLSREAELNPRRYRRRVFLMALAGHCYLFSILAGISFGLAEGLKYGLLPELPALPLAISAALCLWFAVRTSAGRPGAPSGVPVSEQQAPGLFRLLDEVNSGVGNVRIHKVLLNDELNAGVSQIPRSGFSCFPVNYLVVGVPLLKTMSREQCAAVLAHELAHISCGHGLCSDWLHIQKAFWLRFTNGLEGRYRWVSFVFRPFLSRFIPYLNVLSLPLSRANEFEADRIAASVTSSAAMAQALTVTRFAQNFLTEGAGAAQYQSAHDYFYPDGKLHSALERELLSREFPEPGREAGSAPRRRGTHPSLCDRLAALNEKLALEMPAPDKLAVHLLGEFREEADRILKDKERRSTSDV